MHQWILWTLGRDHHGAGRELARGLGVLAPYLANQVKPSGAWDKSKGTRDEWGRRLLRWYWTAQFAVWSVEMIRLHSPGVGPVCPSWWADHCAAWGIGCFALSTRETYVTRAAETGNKIGKGLKTKWKIDRWTAIAKRVMDLSKVPGAPGTLGDQIAQPGKVRHIFDIPQQLGSAVPPLYVAQGRFNQYSVGYWISKTKTTNFWTSKFLPAWNAVFGVLTQAAGSSAFSAWVTAANAIYSAGCQTMRAAAALANGEVSAASDVVAGIGKITGKIGAVVGSEFTIPDDLWSQLKSLEKVSGFSGALGPVMEGEAEYVRVVLAAAQSTDGYHSLDELMGGLVSDD